MSSPCLECSWSEAVTFNEQNGTRLRYFKRYFTSSQRQYCCPRPRVIIWSILLFLVHGQKKGTCKRLMGSPVLAEFRATMNSVSKILPQWCNPVHCSLQAVTALLIHHVQWCDLCIWAYAGQCWPCSQFFMPEIFPIGMDNDIYGLVITKYIDSILTFIFIWILKVEVNFSSQVDQCQKFL